MWSLVTNEDDIDAAILFNIDISEYNVELLNKGYSGLQHLNGKHDWDNMTDNIKICITCRKCIRITKKITKIL